MRYLMALLCPPLALLACKRWIQAIPVTIFYGLAIATAESGVGVMIDFVLILWAFYAVGDDNARREARTFIKTVHQIPIIRR